ncbi:tryptophan-rich sensory protein [Eubacteriales bacterium OttesenSCG-928-M02]|nr:tryptophan-rich sensory protein [Eubacteriales bacterium OttesenSCG-928-M02]
MEQEPISRIAIRRKNTMRNILFSVLMVGLSAGLAIAFTDTENAWYQALVLSPLQPPGWVFRAIWSAVYFILAATLFFLLQQGVRGRTLYAYLVNLALLPLWNYLFFATRNPVAAMLVLLLSLVSSIAMAITSFFHNRWISLALLPYVLWLGYALVLNYAVVMLN